MLGNITKMGTEVHLGSTRRGKRGTGYQDCNEKCMLRSRFREEGILYKKRNVSTKIARNFQIS